MVVIDRGNFADKDICTFFRIESVENVALKQNAFTRFKDEFFTCRNDEFLAIAGNSDRSIFQFRTVSFAVELLYELLG